MSASNVSPLKSPVNSTLDDVRAWGAAMGKKGVIPDASVRLRITATNQLEGVLGDDEPKDAQWFLSNLKQIAQRYSIKNSANPDTAATYESRARRLISDYLGFLQNPTGFEPRVNKPRPSRKDRNGTSEKAKAEEPNKVGAEYQSAETPAPSARVTPTVPSQANTPRLHECPLGKDREPFRYALPEQGLTMADVHRIAIHLAAGTHDFDPANSQVIVKTRLPNGLE